MRNKKMTENINKKPHNINKQRDVKAKANVSAGMGRLT